MSRGRKPKVNPEVVKPDLYLLELETSGETLKGKGESIVEAINSLNLEWYQIKAKGLIKIAFGKNKAEHLFNLQQLKRLFSNKLTRDLWVSRFERLLK